MSDNRSLEQLLEQLSPLHEPAISLLAMREAAKVIRELKSQDEVHWKTRRTLLCQIERSAHQSTAGEESTL